MQSFQQSGHGDIINSWIGSGPNQPIAPDQLHRALGPQAVDNQKTNHSLNLLNLLFLLFIAFLPFPTEVLGEYMLDEANQTTAVTFYASSLLLTRLRGC